MKRFTRKTNRLFLIASMSAGAGMFGAAATPARGDTFLWESWDSEFGGASPGITYTLLGDANLDGVVNAVDFGILAANFNKGVSAWDKGEFDYDNVVRGVDFGELAANFNKGASGASPSLPASDDAALLAFAQANGLTADLPEPVSTASIVLVGSIALSIRRRRMKSV
jgi:hypothetical protein